MIWVIFLGPLKYLEMSNLKVNYRIVSIDENMLVIVVGTSDVMKSGLTERTDMGSFIGPSKISRNGKLYGLLDGIS